LADTSYSEFASVTSAYIYDSPVGGVGTDIAPLRYRLYPNSPNPFVGSTLIRYELARDDRVLLAVYGVGGERVRTLVDQMAQDAGPHSVRWDGYDENGRAVAPGVYFYRLETNRYKKTHCMTLVR
jgi:hypothetical protein